MLSVNCGTAAGPGGGCGEFIIALAEHWDGAQLHCYSHFCQYYIQGELPPWFSMVMSAITNIPLYKTVKKQDELIRPISVSHDTNRLCQGIVASSNRQVVPNYLEPVQLGCSKAGAHKLVHIVRMSNESRKD